MKSIRPSGLSTVEYDASSYTDQIEVLRRIASSALARLYDQERGLFHFKLSGKAKSPVLQVIDDIAPYSTAERYFVITAIGICAYRKRRGDLELGFDFDNAWQRMLGRIQTISSLGDLGLFLWAASFRGDGSSDEIAEILEKRLAAADVRSLSTQDLAWILTGLCFGRRYEPAAQLAKELHGRVSQHGLFRKSASTGRSGRFSHFNSQAYGLLGLAEYFRVSGDRDSGELALAVARKLIQLQGPQGEWAWLYDVDKGTIADRYPVYSVHQDGMGPMAFLACNEVCGLGVDAAIKKSVDWVFGNNELRQSLVDDSSSLIWRSIRRSSKARRKWSRRLAIRRMGQLNNLFSPKEINRESRAYHYGWILYAFS